MSTPVHTESEPTPLTYQCYSAMALVRSAARMLAGPGDKVIYRDAFRWKDDADDDVLSNHYESMSLRRVAELFDYEVVHDFNHVAVVRHRTDENKVSGEQE